MLGVDYDGLDSLRDEFRASKCKVIMVIIPDKEEWSKYKFDITRIVLSETKPSYALSSGRSIPLKQDEERNSINGIGVNSIYNLSVKLQ